MFVRGGMLTLDGRCKTLDADADGYGRLEGTGALVAYNASAAAADCAWAVAPGQIVAVLAGSSVNQDGRSSSLTAPNGPSQQKLVAAALHAAGITADDLCAIQLHGTGTPLGDPIEVGALLDGLAGQLSKSAASSSSGSGPSSAFGPLTLTAAKSAYGHGETTAGMVGISQALQTLNARVTPPVLHLRAVNPYVATQLDGFRRAHRGLAVPREASGLSSFRDRAATGISAFAFQGTNAHCVVVRRDTGLAFSAPSVFFCCFLVFLELRSD